MVFGAEIDNVVTASRDPQAQDLAKLEPWSPGSC